MILWMSANIIIGLIGLFLIYASGYFDRLESTDFMETLMSGTGFGCIIFFILSEGVR